MTGNTEAGRPPRAAANGPSDAGGLRDAARGALLGAALGDAIGRPFEGARRVDPARVDALLDGSEPLRWTDDTHLLLALGDALVDRDGAVDAQHLGAVFAAAYDAEPWRGYGSGPPQVYAMAAEGIPYVEAAARLFGGSGSWGNGAAMRVAPAAVVGHADAERAAALAAEQSLVTHAHPQGRDAAVLLAVVIRAALVTDPSARLVLPEPPASCHLDVVIAEAWQDLRALEPGSKDRTAYAQRVGTSVLARESVPAAVALALAASASPVDTIRTAISLGGDTDTVACMAGAIVGAHRGASALPPGLLDRLEARDRIQTLAEALLAVAAGGGPVGADG